MKAIRLDELPEQIRKQVIRQLDGERITNRDKASGVPSERKRDSGYERVAKEEAARHNGQHDSPCPVRITYIDTRKRLLDADNGWTKFFTDALVTAGLLQDDSPQFIPERPSVKQVKADADQPESLTIIIEAI